MDGGWAEPRRPAMLHTMHPALRTWLEEHEGVITSAEANAIGLTPRDLAVAVDRQELGHVCRAGYVDHRLEETADPMAAHLLRLRAVLRARPGAVVASHMSAALVWGLPVSYAHLDRVHVARDPARRTTRRYTRHTLHEGYPSDATTRVDGTGVVVVTLAVLGTALLCGVVPGLMAADAALRMQLTTREDLERWMEELARTPGMSAARAAVRQSSPTAESPGESWLRVVLTSLGFEVVPQFVVRTATGTVLARVDFLLPVLGVIVEFDGSVKYAGPAASGQHALMAEKRREDDLRRLGYAVVRVTWPDLRHPDRIRDWVWAAARTVAIRPPA